MCSAPPAPQPDPELQTAENTELRERAAKSAQQRAAALGNSNLNLTGGLGDVSESTTRSTQLGA